MKLNNLKTFLRTSSLLLACVYFLSSCAVVDTYLGDAFAPSKEVEAAQLALKNIETVLPSEGAIAFTVTFEAPAAGKSRGLLQGSHQGTNFYTLKGKKITDGMFGLAYMAEFEANKTHTVFYKLEPNAYHFHKVYFRGGELILPKPIAFNVSRGELSYIGHLHFKLPEKSYGAYTSSISNNSEQFLAQNQAAIKKSPLKFVTQLASEKQQK